MNKISEDDLTSDLGLFDTDNSVVAQVQGKVAPPQQVVRPQRISVPSKMQAEETPAPAPAPRLATKGPTGLVSEEVENIPGVGTFTHRVHAQQGHDIVSQMTSPQPQRVVAPEIHAQQPAVQTLAPGRNPDWVGQPGKVAPTMELKNGQLQPVNTPTTMGAVAGKVGQLAPEPVEPTATELISEALPGGIQPGRYEVEPTKAKKARKGDLDEAPTDVKDVMILRPILRSVHSSVHHATLALFDKNTYRYDAQQGDAMVYHSRNMLADRFMKSGFEWALWWDDDVIPPIGDEAWMRGTVQSMPTTYPKEFLRINAIQRLKSHGKSLIGGLYFARKAPWTAICHRTKATETAFKAVPRVELKPVDWVGTGFLLVHRSVFESIQQAHPELAPKAGAVNEYESVWNYFQPNHQQGEDVSFCARAKACGHQPFVDLSVVCFHVGDYAFGPWNQR